MATHDNAELLALSGPRSPYPGRLGVVEAGALADLLLVDGDPLENITLVADAGDEFRRHHEGRQDLQELPALTPNAGTRARIHASASRLNALIPPMGLNCSIAGGYGNGNVMSTVAELHAQPGHGPANLTAFVDRWIFVFMAARFLASALAGFIPDSLEKVAAEDAKPGAGRPSRQVDAYARGADGHVAHPATGPVYV